MQRRAFAEVLAQAIERQPSDLEAGKLLEAADWDSLCELGFIATVHHSLGIRVSAQAVAACRTTDELFALLKNHITP